MCAITIGDEDGCWLTLEILGSTEKGRKNGRSTQSTWTIFFQPWHWIWKKERRFPYSDQTAKITDCKDHRLQAYKLLTSLVTPAKPGEKDYTQLVQVLIQHFDPAPSKIVQRYCFNMRNRFKGETVTAYVSELWGLAQFCNFGESLDIMLRDRLVCRISDEAIDNLWPKEWLGIIT